MEQGHCGGDVLAHPGEARKGFIISDDPLIYLMGHDACAPTIFTAFDLAIDLRVFPHKLLSSFIDLQLLGP